MFEAPEFYDEWLPPIWPILLREKAIDFVKWLDLADGPDSTWDPEPGFLRMLNCTPELLDF